MQGLIDGDRPFRVIAAPSTNDLERELLPGEVLVGPYGEGAKAPTLEGIYWTRNFRFDPMTGDVLPDVIRSHCNGLTPGVRVALNPKTRQYDVDISQWAAHQQELGHIRVDGILGDMPPECDYDYESYANYVRPLMTEKSIAALKEKGVDIEPRAFIQLTSRRPPEFTLAIARSKGDTPDDVKRKVEAGERATKTLAAYKATLAKVYGIKPGSIQTRA